MHDLDFLGLNEEITDEFLPKFMGYIWEEGRSFPGYKMMYHYMNFGHVEFIVGMSNQEDEPYIFNTHVMGNYFWKLEVSSFGEYTNEGLDCNEKIVFFRQPAGRTIVPVFLIMHDVIPSYLEGDSVYMQIYAFPIDIHYYKDEERYQKACPPLMGGSLCMAPNQIFALPTSAFSTVNGKIKSVTKLIQASNDASDLLCVVIDTDFGELPIVHAISRVEENERDFIKEGCIVSAVCFIQGDVALEEYNPGARYDEINILRLLRSCMKDGDYARMSDAFAEDCVYFSAKTGQEKARGKDAVLADLMDIYAQQHKDTGFEQITMLAGITECAKAELLGRHCIILQVKGNEIPYGALMVELDDKGKIKEMHGVPAGSKLQPILPTQPEPDDESIGFEDSEMYYMIGDEDMWLGRMKGAIDELEFQLHTYWGILDDADLEIYEEGKDTKIIHGQQKIWEAFNDLFEVWKNVECLKTDIVPISETNLDMPKENKSVLRVQLDDKVVYIKLSISDEKQKISKIRLYLFDITEERI